MGTEHFSVETEDPLVRASKVCAQTEPMRAEARGMPWETRSVRGLGARAAALTIDLCGEASPAVAQIARASVDSEQTTLQTERVALAR